MPDYTPIILQGNPAYAALQNAVALARAVLAGHYANDDTDTDVPGGAAGERGAKFWNAQAHAAAEALANKIDFEGTLDPLKLFRFTGTDADGVEREAGSVSTDGVWTLAGGLASLMVAGYSLEFEETLYSQPRLLGVDPDGVTRVIIDPTTPGTPQELIDARGDATSLDERLSAALTDEGLLVDPVPMRALLRRLRAKEVKLLDGDTVLATLALLGDSWTARSLYSPRVTKRLKALYGDGGNGFVGFANSSALLGLPAADSRTSAAIFTLTTPAGTWTVNSTYTAPTANCCEVVCSSVNGRLQIVASSAVAANTVAKLLYRPTAGGSVRYSWDGGSNWETTLDLSTGYVATLNNLPATAGWTLLIEDLTGNAALTGLNLRKASGLLVHKLGSSGSTSGQWAAQAVTAGFQAHWAELAPDAVTICHGTNDQTGGVAASAVAANYATIAGGVRAAKPWTNEAPVDLLYVAPAENLRTTNAVAMAAYALAIQSQAHADGAAFLDLQDCLGDDSTTAWWEGDLIHPEETYGGPAIAAAFIDMLKL